MPGECGSEHEHEYEGFRWTASHPMSDLPCPGLIPDTADYCYPCCRYSDRVAINLVSIIASFDDISWVQEHHSRFDEDSTEKEFHMSLDV